MVTEGFYLAIVAKRERGLFDDEIAAACHACGAPPIALSPGEAAGFALAPGQDGWKMQAAVRTALGDAPVDVLVSPPRTRPCRVLLADMDSTIVTTETLDELAVKAGIGDEIAAITRRAMNGEIDFKGALRLRVGKLRGLPVGAVAATLAETRLMPGARSLVQTMNRLGALTALVSGGFTVFTGPIAAQCGFARHFSNTLLDDGEMLTGEVAEPILDKETKRATLAALARELGCDEGEAVTVGDGANDLPMLQAAGLGVAYHAKPVVRAAVANAIQYADLRAILFAQGIPASDFAA
jgi:phosphoserine phosphatase